MNEPRLSLSLYGKSTPTDLFDVCDVSADVNMILEGGNLSSPQQDPIPSPDFHEAFALLNNPKYVKNMNALQRFLDALGVSVAEDLAELDTEDFRMIFGHLKKISLKKFHRFLCLGEIDSSLWGPPASDR